MPEIPAFMSCLLLLVFGLRYRRDGYGKRLAVDCLNLVAFFHDLEVILVSDFEVNHVAARTLERDGAFLGSTAIISASTVISSTASGLAPGLSALA
jgi:hypothetical protein